MHIYIYARKPHVYPRGGSQLQPPLGALVLNSWLVSSLSLFSTNLTNYLIWIVSEKGYTCVPPRGLSSQPPPLGPLVLNSWLISSLSLFSTNLTNYLIWKPDRVLLSLY